MDPNYLLAALIWSLVGFLCGYTFAMVQLGHVRKGVPQIKLTWNRWISVLLIVMGIFTVGQTYYFSDKQRKLVNCQETVNQEIRRVAREERRDYFEVWRKILNSPSRDESKKIFQDHLDRGDAREAKRDEAEKTRKRC